MYKRKRYSGKSRTYSKKKRGSYIKPYQKGYIRKSGAYGRFKGTMIEQKFHDVDLDDATVANNGTITPSVNLIAQGTGPSARIGRKITIKKIMWSITMDAPTEVTLSNGADVVRFIMYVDKQCNGATATVTDILASASHLSYRNLNNSARFRILFDDTRKYQAYTAIGIVGALEVGQGEHHFSLYKDCNIPLEFDSTTGAITEIRSNNIGVLLISHRGVPRVTSKIRLRYTDI